MSARGHFWTIYPHLRDFFRARRHRSAEPWTIDVPDRVRGRVTLSGELIRGARDRPVVVLVHGLGGTPRSVYCRAMARELAASGYSVLSFAMRGADGLGADLFHGGLWEDVASVATALRDDGFEAVDVCGFSIGGHVALRLATHVEPGLVRSVAAICPPLHLADAREFIDTRAHGIYKRRVLGGLKASYEPLAAIHGAEFAVPVDRVRRARSIYEWDSLTVVPRFGFRDPDDYYAREAVAERLGEIRVPTLIVAARPDPVVPADVIEPHLVVDAPLLDVRWVENGGHLGFPRRLDLGFDGRAGLPGQVAAWAESAADPGRELP